MFPEIKINGSILTGVPAVHYRALFAREVNNICSCKETRPEAIAVELPPHITREIICWMKELGVNKSEGIVLPCMLGILYKNRVIHPDLRDTAFNIQEFTGRSLANTSPEILKQFLNYSDKCIVGISSTDSIIEAIRCGVELGIPVYGVDMDEFAVKPTGSFLFQDPDEQEFHFDKYVSQNERMSSCCRDPYTDGRREYIMSARLKRILCKYRNVLFTGGLAHWLQLKDLLTDPELRPADFLVPGKSPSFERTIIHPSMALAFMDSYPVLTTIYEMNRRHPAGNFRLRFPLPDKRETCRQILAETYDKFHKEYSYNKAFSKTANGIEMIPEFERLLTNFSLFHQNYSPSISELLVCGDSMMTSGFNGILLTRLMDIGRPWASHKQFPELPVLSYVPNNQTEKENLSHTDFFQFTDSWQDKNDHSISDSNTHDTFTVGFHNAKNPSEQHIRQWLWEDDPLKQKGRKSYYVWVWPPCEAILYGAAYEASRIALTRSKEPLPALFEGSLYDGIDIKRTMRSVINGEKKIYIKKPRLEKKRFIPDGKNPEPVVFIFDNENTEMHSRWSLLIGGTNLGKHVRNKVRYNDIVRKSGSFFISSIGWISDIEVPSSLHGHIDSLSILDGYTALGNPCINSKQAAQWLEDNDYKCCPVMTNTSIVSLIEYYRNNFQMELSVTDWVSTLIKIAIPYAKERFVVLAPKDFRIPAKLINEAGSRNISIDYLPLDYFSEEHVTEMRKRIMLRASDPDGLSYPQETEKALGQKADKYFELLPVYMQLQLKKTKL